MTKIFSILTATTLLWILPCYAQDSLRYPQMDKHALRAPKIVEDLPKLVAYLIKPAGTDFEKARSLFTWLIHYLDFDEKAYRNGNKRLNHSTADILRRRKAVCFGYAQLYKELCQEAGLHCEIISGYAKIHIDDSLKAERPNHAWNAVQLEGEWYLLDATWASNLLYKENDFWQRYHSSYFLTPSSLFILEHLPADPIWQLLPCPITAEQFQMNSTQLYNAIDTLLPCTGWADSLRQFTLLSPLQKQLKTAFNAYRFVPSKANARELGATYMDYEFYLSEYADSLQLRGQFDSLQLVQLEMLALCERADSLDFLFDSQRENCAYTHMNYATALSEKANSTNDKSVLKSIYAEMQHHFQIAEKTFKSIPLNMFTRQALEGCEEYLEWLEGHLKAD